MISVQYYECYRTLLRGGGPLFRDTVYIDTNQVLPTPAAPLVPAMPPRPKLVGPQVLKEVPAVDVNPISPVVVVVVVVLLAGSIQTAHTAVTLAFCLTDSC